VTDPLHSKLDALFNELVGARASSLSADIPHDAVAAINAALRDLPAETAADLAFHMTDWNRDAAFVVALLLFPDRFTPEEVREGLRGFLIHAPNHVVAAAKLGGWPVADIFEIGALDGDRVSGDAV
jgi:hypothetical protein